MPGEQVAGWKFSDGSENRAVAGSVQEREVVIESVDIELARDIRRLEERFHLRAEVETVLGLGVVERLNADATPSEKQGFRSRVPDGQSEHTPETRNGAAAPLFVGMHDRLGVAVRVERVTRPLEIGAQLLKVVDLAVEHDPDGAVFVVNRLMAGGEIDDAQAPHAECDTVVDPDALVVGAAMTDHVAHSVGE